LYKNEQYNERQITGTNNHGKSPNLTAHKNHGSVEKQQKFIKL